MPDWKKICLLKLFSAMPPIFPPAIGVVVAEVKPRSGAKCMVLSPMPASGPKPDCAFAGLQMSTKKVVKM